MLILKTADMMSVRSMESVSGEVLALISVMPVNRKLSSCCSDTCGRGVRVYFVLVMVCLASSLALLAAMRAILALFLVKCGASGDLFLLEGAGL